MSIRGIGQSYYQSNTARANGTKSAKGVKSTKSANGTRSANSAKSVSSTESANSTKSANSAKSTKSANSTEKSAAGKTGSTKELSEAQEMAVFKKEFYAELERIPRDRTIENVAINISEEAFKNMKDNPEYREQMLSVIRRDLTSSVAPAPNCSLVITVGATAKDYRGDSWSVGYDSEFYARSQNSFYKKTSGRKDRQKELLEEYLEKRVQAKKQQQKVLDEKIAKAELERSRQAKAWSSQRQMTKASSAYEANVMAETMGGIGGDMPV